MLHSTVNDCLKIQLSSCKTVIELAKLKVPKPTKELLVKVSKTFRPAFVPPPGVPGNMLAPFPEIIILKVAEVPQGIVVGPVGVITKTSTVKASARAVCGLRPKTTSTRRSEKMR
jgi:hypothetical protein